MIERLCAICTKPFLARRSHAERAKTCSVACRVMYVARVNTQAVAERFWKFVEKTDTCLYAAVFQPI